MGKDRLIKSMRTQRGKRRWPHRACSKRRTWPGPVKERQAMISGTKVEEQPSDKVQQPQCAHCCRRLLPPVCMLPQNSTDQQDGSAVRTTNGTIGPPQCKASRGLLCPHLALLPHPGHPDSQALAAFSLTDSIPNVSPGWHPVPSGLCALSHHLTLL